MLPEADIQSVWLGSTMERRAPNTNVYILPRASLRSFKKKRLSENYKPALIIFYKYKAGFFNYSNEVRTIYSRCFLVLTLRVRTVYC